VADVNLFLYYYHENKYTTALAAEIGKYLPIQDDMNSITTHLLVLQMGASARLVEIKEQNPQIQYGTYVWDCYDWIWEGHDRGGNEHNWDEFGELCKVSEQLWTPSLGQKKRLKEYWDIDNCDIIPAYAQLFDYDDEITDGNYIFNPLRKIPDRQYGWFEQACDELNIPYKTSGKEQGEPTRSWDEYKKVVADASFIVSTYYEASTGGMTLWEGYNIGKEILVCDSPYHGTKEHFGDRAHYFSGYEDLKVQLKRLWDTKDQFPTRSLESKQEFCQQFTVEEMALNLVSSITDTGFCSI